ncbi:MAG TPA: histidine ammonia-lyase [Candidatus Saccharimonadales bacterium]|nr:histidine ammonia-lyase [Candidatus Saccharimonadales bacterium]
MLTINNQDLTFEDVYRVATGKEKVALGKTARQKVERTRTAIEKAVDNNEIIYGVTTGFGAFKNTAISPQDVAKLQENLIKSHAVGVGPLLEEAVVRGMMFLMANYLSKGYSGVRPVVIETLIELLNKGVCPAVPEQGSVGSSGDLAPSAHVILVLIGLGEVVVDGKTVSCAPVLKKAGIKPVQLQAKEGLALINNTSCMTAVGCVAMHEATRLLEVADEAGALSAEALRATTKAFDADIHRIKPHAGQIATAARLRELLKGSTMVNNDKTQDQYSLRCMPQIHGAVREAYAYVKKVVNTEINSVTDNPLIFFDAKNNVKVISGGNFHGEAMAVAMDTLGHAMSELANVSDRRIASIVDPATSNGLPAFLVEKGGLNSGFMILQYTTAALVSENKVLSHPASVDSVPTSANIEDLVSMGTIAARKARSILRNITNVLAIELLTACQAIDFRLKEGYKLGKQTSGHYKAVRKLAPYFPEDAVYYPYVNKLAEQVVRNG